MAKWGLRKALTELIVVDAFTAGKVGTLEPGECVEDSDDDQAGKQQQPHQGDEVGHTHELWACTGVTHDRVVNETPHHLHIRKWLCNY